MPGWVRVDLEALSRVDVIGRLQQGRPKGRDLVMSRLDVLDVEVEVHLLRRAIGPLRRNMVGGELHRQAWFAVHADRVPIVILIDTAVEHSTPERTFGSQIGGVENKNLSADLHLAILMLLIATPPVRQGAHVTTPLLWLIGPSGVGKSSVGWAIFSGLYRGGIKSGYVDLDQLGLCYPQPADDPDNHRVKAANLAVVWPTYRKHGARCLIVCGGAEVASLVPVYIAQVPDTEPTLVRLRASHATLRERILARGRGHGPALPGAAVGLPIELLDRMAQDAAAEADDLDRSDFAHACIDTEGRTVTELAGMVRAAAGDWPRLG